MTPAPQPPFRRRSRRGTALGAAFVVALSLVLSACGSGGSSTASSSETVKWAVVTPVTSWDPVAVGASSATYWLSTIYSSLFTLDETGKPKPELASGWKYNDKGDQITITLKPDLTFQDGSPVDAEAVKFNLERIKNQANSNLKGSYANIRSATVVDPLNVRLDLGSTDYQVPYLLSNRGGLLASKKAAENPEKLGASAPVGAGPFKVTELVPESHVYLEKWDGYWDAKDINVKRIELTLGVDPTTLVAGFKSGVYNFAGHVLSLGDVTQLRDAGFDVQTDTKAAWAHTFLTFNLNKEPFKNPAVFEAIQYAINRQEFVDKLGFGFAEVAEQPFPSTHIAYNKALEGKHAYDPAKAKAILAAAGFKDGDVKFDLVAGASQQASTEILQSQLKAVGIETKISIPEASEYAKNYFGKQYPFAFYGYVGRDSAVQALSELYEDGGIANLSSPITSPEFQAAAKLARETPLDSPDYAKNLQAATAAGYENGSAISLFTAPQPYAKSSKISDLPLIDGVLSWKGVTISK